MNLTILILSYERHEELEKKISYWNYLSSFRYKILIIDGSTKPLKVNLKNKNQSIIAQNSDQILKSIDQFEQSLMALKSSLAEEDLDGLHKILQDGQLVRKTIEKSK